MTYVFSQALKLLAVTQFLIGQYYKAIFKADQDVRRFFTWLYLQHSYGSSHRVTPPIEEIKSLPDTYLAFPVIDASDVLPNLPGVMEAYIYNDTESILDGDTMMSGAILRPREQVIMNALVRVKRPEVVFEFGTAVGVTTYNLFKNTQDTTQIYTFDWKIPPTKNPELTELFQNPRVHYIEGSSLTYDFSRFYDSCDFIFVDGGHEFAFVVKDTLNALKMIKKGGMILWHDFGANFPDVVACINSFAEKYPIRRIDETTFAVLIA